MSTQQRPNTRPTAATTDVTPSEDAVGSEAAAMMYTVTVGADGKVILPGTQPGETIRVSVETSPVGRRPRTPEEIEIAVQRTLENARQVRAQSTPEDRWRAINHGEWLYDENGLPK